jgi:hypothetical protein
MAMCRFLLGTLLIFVFALSSVKADIVPRGGRRDPDPPPPPGPEKAVIRGVTMARAYGYHNGRRWLSYIDACESTQPACKDKEVHGCLITEVDDRPVESGSIAYLQALEKSSDKRAMKLTLSGCGVSELVLLP